MDEVSCCGKLGAKGGPASWTHRWDTGGFRTDTTQENIMNIRNTLAALALGLASTVAMAATTPAAPATPASPAAAAPAKAKAKAKPVAHKAVTCKQDESLVKGKCEKKAQS
jgi:hypothetical protein